MKYRIKLTCRKIGALGSQSEERYISLDNAVDSSDAAKKALDCCYEGWGAKYENFVVSWVQKDRGPRWYPSAKEPLDVGEGSPSTGDFGEGT